MKTPISTPRTAQTPVPRKGRAISVGIAWKYLRGMVYFLVVLYVFTFYSAIRGAAEREALVIGNGADQHGNLLKRRTADASDIVAARQECGFELAGATTGSTGITKEWSAGLAPFTNTLEKGLLLEGAEIHEVFRRVGAGVWQATGSREPWLDTSC